MNNSNTNFLEPSQEELNTILKYYQTGQYVNAEKLSLLISQKFLKHPFVWKVLGVVLKLTGRIIELLVACQKFIHLNSHDRDAYNNLGITLQELGRLEDAEINIRQAISLKSDNAEAYNNLGAIQQEIKNLVDSETSLRRAILLKPNYAEAYSNLGVTLKELSKLEDAETSIRQAIILKPNYAEAYNNLGLTLQEMGRMNEAETSYKKVIELKPDFAAAYYNLGGLLNKYNKLEEAKTCLKKAILCKPDYEEAKHLLSALTGKTTNSASRKYVETLFDNYAIDFEHSLVNKLEYNIPNKIIKIIIIKNPDIQLGSVLDLGCGTGLIGDVIRKYCSNLVGVDLSKSMLEKANAKNIYEKLEHKDIIEYLSTEDLDFNYFISTDVFIYTGELSEVFRLIKFRNRSNGKFIFSTEHTDRNGFFLKKSGLFSHSKKYIETLCNKFGYKLSYFETTNLRRNNDSFIKGGLYLLDF